MGVCVGFPQTRFSNYTMFCFANVLLTTERGRGGELERFRGKIWRIKIVLLENNVKIKNRSHSLFAVRMDERREKHMRLVERLLNSTGRGRI